MAVPSDVTRVFHLPGTKTQGGYLVDSGFRERFHTDQAVIPCVPFRGAETHVRRMPVVAMPGAGRNDEPRRPVTFGQRPKFIFVVEIAGRCALHDAGQSAVERPADKGAVDDQRSRVASGDVHVREFTFQRFTSGSQIRERLRCHVIRVRHGERIQSDTARGSLQPFPVLCSGHHEQFFTKVDHSGVAVHDACRNEGKDHRPLFPVGERYAVLNAVEKAGWFGRLQVADIRDCFVSNDHGLVDVGPSGRG